MWEYQREECNERQVQVGASLFCHCGTPFADRYRHVPCQHVLCSACALEVDSCDVCPICHEQSECIERIHPNDSLYICKTKGCDRGFLNFPSLRLHAKLEHDVDATSVVDFYSKTGDIIIQFGDVHKISHEGPKDAEGDSQTGAEESKVKDDGLKSVTTRTVATIPKQARTVGMDQEKDSYDDLEELM